jgi:outer membrane receptor for ferrienterochelin and colicins
MTDPERPGDRACGGGLHCLTRRADLRPAMLLAAMLALSSPVAAQSSLQDLSLEDLMQMDAGQVFGASERLQPVTEAPASVSFITAQEIARYGYRTLADILRGVRGMYVTNDRNFSFLGTRGFGKPGDFNSRILLLVNGHRVNDNIYGQAEIGAEFGLDPAMYERVEIIRGPASSLYGDSAFFAVVNVITRTGASLGGASVTVEDGTLGTRLVRASAGTSLASGVDLALSGTYEHSDGVGKLYFPAFDSPATNHGIAEGLDGEGMKQLYAHLLFKDLAVTAAYGSRQRDIPTASNDTLFNSQLVRQETTDRHGLLDAYYGHSFRGTRLTVRASYDQFSYDGVFPFAVEADGTPTNVGLIDGLGSRWSVSTGLSRTLPGRQTIRVGSEFIDNLHQDQTTDFIGATTPLFDIKHSSKQHAFYVQDEIKPRRWFIVNGGLRYDAYEQFVKVTPRVALILLPSSIQSLKYLYGSAFRAPNEFELNTFYFGDQVTRLRPESIDTHELVWERYISDRVRTSLSTYWYKADRLITPIFDESTFLKASFVNQGQVRAKGLELETQIRIKGESRALVSYALQKAVDQQTHEELPNSPHHVVKARISLPGPMPRSFISVEGQYLSRRDTLTRADREDGFKYPTSVSGAATLNINVVQPLGRSWELSGMIRNLFDADYSDPVSALHQQGAVPQNGRTARIGLTWKLWQH